MLALSEPISVPAVFCSAVILRPTSAEDCEVVMARCRISVASTSNGRVASPPRAAFDPGVEAQQLALLGDRAQRARDAADRPEPVEESLQLTIEPGDVGARGARLPRATARPPCGRARARCAPPQRCAAVLRWRRGSRRAGVERVHRPDQFAEPLGLGRNLPVEPRDDPASVAALHRKCLRPARPAGPAVHPYLP